MIGCFKAFPPHLLQASRDGSSHHHWFGYFHADSLADTRALLFLAGERARTHPLLARSLARRETRKIDSTFSSFHSRDCAPSSCLQIYDSRCTPSFWGLKIHMSARAFPHRNQSARGGAHADKPVGIYIEGSRNR